MLTSVGALVSLGAVYSHVQTLAGWTFGEAVLVAGVFMIVNGLLLTFVEPNLEWFAEKLRTRINDDIYVRPVSSVFLTSFATSRPWSLVDALIGVVVAGIGLRSLDGPVTVGGVFAGLALIGVGLIAAWAIRFACATVSFWALGLELSVFWYAPWTLGRYPVDAYGRVRPDAAHLRPARRVRVDVPRPSPHARCAR